MTKVRLTNPGGFKIVLYSTQYATALYECSTTHLPLLGRLIELETGTTIFKVKKQNLLPTADDGVLLYILYGDVITAYSELLDIETIRQRLADKTIDIETNSYGDVLFP